MGEDDSILRRAAPEPDVVVAWGPGPEDIADVQLGGDDRPLVILLHGGFWRPTYDRSHMHAMAHALAAEGFTAAVTEYRRIPGEPDPALADVRVALRVLPVELRGRHDGRVIVVGHSAGGQLALWAAAVAKAAGLVGTLALAPVADMAGAEVAGIGGGAVRDFLGGPASSRPDLDPTRMMSATTAVSVLHGADDDLVPAALSQSYADAHPDATLTVLPGTGHFGLIDPLSPAWPRTLAALDLLASTG